MTDLATIDTNEIETQIAPVVQSAEALIVRNVDEHRIALEMLGKVMAAERAVKRAFKPLIDAAMDSKRKAETARQEAVAMQDRFLAPVEDARKTISKKAADFEAEERKAAALIQDQLRREALAKQEQQRQMDAAMADTEEAAEDVLTEPLAPPPVAIVKPEVAKVAGVTSRMTWDIEVTDLKAFYRWCVETDNLFMAGEPNLVALRMRARAEHEALAIPGMKAVYKIGHVNK